MAFDRPEHLRKIGMKKNETRNPKGSTQKVRIVKSPLRKTADSLREIEEDCLTIIKAAVRAEDVDKTALDTAKWTISMIQTLDKSASAEEISNAKVRLDAKKAEDAGAGLDNIHQAEVIKSRLSLVYEEPGDED